MRILRVASDLYPSIVGGIGIHVHEMSRIQAKRGHEVTVVTHQNTDQSPIEQKEDYITIRIPATVRIFGNTVSISLPLTLLKMRNQFDIIHAHSHLYFSTVVCAALRRLGSAPLIITNHGTFSQTAPAWLQKIYSPTIARWTFNSADRIVCYTETEKQQLSSLGVQADRINVIHNGIDTNAFLPSQDPPKNQILWIGRFTPGKGIEYLIDSFKAFSENHPGYTLHMIGRGLQKEEIVRKIQDLGLERSISLQDFIPNADLPEIYQQSILFVLPSLEEGVPRTILEAMSCGIPVVCTELPQLTDIVSGSGILVPVKNSQAIADAMSQIISSSDLARTLGENGRKRVLTGFSWDDTVCRTLDLYQEILGSDTEYQHRLSHGSDPSSQGSNTAPGTGGGK